MDSGCHAIDRFQALCSRSQRHIQTGQEKDHLPCAGQILVAVQFQGVSFVRGNQPAVGQQDLLPTEHLHQNNGHEQRPAQQCGMENPFQSGRPVPVPHPGTTKGKQKQRADRCISQILCVQLDPVAFLLQPDSNTTDHIPSHEQHQQQMRGVNPDSRLFSSQIKQPCCSCQAKEIPEPFGHPENVKEIQNNAQKCVQDTDDRS